MKTHLIIGASSGIGKQLAKTLAEAGDKVIGTYRKTQAESKHPNIVYQAFDVLNLDASTDFITEEKIKANAERHPLKKIGHVQDIGGMAEFLLSDKAGWITGQVMHVDGGMSSIKT